MEPNTSSPKESLIAFPTHFPIKVMGENSPDFPARVLQAAQAIAPETQETDVRHQPSSQGNYLGVTLKVWVQSQAQLDEIYQALTALAGVRMVL